MPSGILTATEIRKNSRGDFQLVFSATGTGFLVPGKRLFVQGHLKT
jgi:hypothetical protein